MADCVNHDYICKTNGLGIKYLDSDIRSVNSFDYGGCIYHCFQDTTCKVFEFDPTQRVCKFASVFFDNTQFVPTSVLLWKKTSNITCKEDLAKGMPDLFHQHLLGFICMRSYMISKKLVLIKFILHPFITQNQFLKWA